MYDTKFHCKKLKFPLEHVGEQIEDAMYAEVKHTCFLFE